MKRTVFTGLMVMLILSTAVTAQAAHTHEYTKQNSKVYVCECGKAKPLYSLKGERVITLNCNGVIRRNLQDRHRRSRYGAEQNQTSAAV